MYLFENNMLQYVFYPFITHLISYWGSSLFFIHLDKKYNIYEKIGHDKYIKAIKNSIYNQFLITLPLTYLLKTHIKNSIIKSAYDGILLSIIKIFIITNISNFIFYWLHRLLHYKLFYKYVHKIHHEYIIPIAPCALYAHRIEHILCNNLAFMIPFIIIGMRYELLLASICLGSINTTMSHTKYMKSININHYIHHQKFNYNYGFGSSIDKLFKTHYLTEN